MTVLDRLEAQAEIADLIHSYALAIRRDQPEDVEALFRADGTFEVREGAPDQADTTSKALFPSPQALVAYLVSTKGQPHPVPMIHNLMIQVNGDAAFASSLMIGPILGTKRRVFGEYADSFIKAEEGWRFSGRIFTVFRESD